MLKKLSMLFFAVILMSNFVLSQNSFAQNQSTKKSKTKTTDTASSDGSNSTKSQQIEKLARETSNPVTRLWMLSLKEEIGMHEVTNGMGTGPYSAGSATILQPIMSFGINDKWAFLLRFVFPILGYQDSFVKGNADKKGSTGGLGNTGWTLMMTPKANSPLIIGFGVSGQIPTATPSYLQNSDWTLGPAMILGFKTKIFILAGIISYTVPLYTNGGQYKPVTDVQLMYNFNLPNGWSIGDGDLHFTYDQSKAPGDRWSTPIGIGFGKLFFAGRLPLKINLEYNIDLSKHNESKYNNSIILSFTAIIPSMFQ